MPTYLFGDLHGCLDTFEALLERLAFEPAIDRLWLTGDLVNRGPCSLEVLRRVRELGSQMGERLVVVLGNHDLQLLARQAGVARKRPKDAHAAVLAAPDAGELLAWLRERPLLHREGEALLVHAGLLPAWTPEAAEALARETENTLRAEGGVAALLGPPPEPAIVGREETAALERRRRALAALTRLRTCTADGELCAWNGPPEGAPPGCRPWYRLRRRRRAGVTVYFGHWAALGFHRERGAVCLDSGCAWGHRLTALRLDDGEVFHEPARERR